MQTDQTKSNPPAKPTLQPDVKIKRRRSVLISIVLPITVFVLLIGGIAWLAQNVSHWRKPQLPETSSKPKFVFHNKVHKKPAEHVVGSSGHFDYPFSNTGDDGGKFGITRISCQCSSVKVALFTPAEWGDSTAPKKGLLDKADWMEITPFENAVDVPPNSRGIVRIDWHDREKLPKLLRLGVKTWFQPNQSGEGSPAELQALLRLAAPIRCLPLRLNLGEIDDQGYAEAHFWCWSPFFEEFDLAVVEKNRLFEYIVSPLDDKMRTSLQAKLVKLAKLKKYTDSTTVKGAMRVTVRVHAKKGDKHLDLGPFVRQVVLKSLGKKYDKTGPLLTGRVQGPITVGHRIKDRGRIQLPRFLAVAGITQTVRISAPKEMNLRVVKTVPTQIIDAKDVLLKKDEKASNFRSIWSLTVTIGPGKASLGLLPDDCAVFLQTGDNPPRLIRIPIIGYAKRR